MKTKFSQGSTEELFVRADSLERGVALTSIIYKSSWLIPTDIISSCQLRNHISSSHFRVLEANMTIQSDKSQTFPQAL